MPEATPQMFKSMFRLGSRATPTGSDLTLSKFFLSLPTQHNYYTINVPECQIIFNNRGTDIISKFSYRFSHDSPFLQFSIGYVKS